MTRSCPFCSAQVAERICPDCSRDTTAPRLVCKKCGGMAPASERECCHCGAANKSELRWKIPLIIGMFTVAIILSILLRIAGN